MFGFPSIMLLDSSIHFLEVLLGNSSLHVSTSPCISVVFVNLLIKDVKLSLKDCFPFINFLVGIEVLEYMLNDCSDFWIS